MIILNYLTYDLYDMRGNIYKSLVNTDNFPRIQWRHIETSSEYPFITTSIKEEFKDLPPEADGVNYIVHRETALLTGRKDFLWVSTFKSGADTIIKKFYRLGTKEE